MSSTMPHVKYHSEKNGDGEHEAYFLGIIYLGVTPEYYARPTIPRTFCFRCTWYFTCCEDGTRHVECA